MKTRFLPLCYPSSLSAILAAFRPYELGVVVDVDDRGNTVGEPIPARRWPTGRIETDSGVVVEAGSAIDPACCMAPADRTAFGGPRCQKPATHDTPFGRHCAACADALRKVMRDPDAALNAVSGRGCTEDEIAGLIRELPS